MRILLLGSVARTSVTPFSRPAHSTQEDLLEDVRPVAASVRAITKVITSGRTGRPLSSR